MTSIHDRTALEAYRRSRGIDPGLLRNLRNALYKRGLSAEAALARLPAEERSEFARAFEFHALDLVERRDSQLDGASKLVFRTRQGDLIESVAMRMSTGRRVLCASTQAGCAERCQFCATGRMGFARNLTPGEILDQLIQANQLLRTEAAAVRNVVFMGMGEPLHNEENLYAAIEVLIDSHGFGLRPQRILISTVGIPDALVRCARRFRQVRLAVSLHSARGEVRRRLMPVAARHSLDDLRAALVEATAVQKHLIMIEYLLLKGINDAPQDVDALATYLTGIPVHVNVIPYNPIGDAGDLVAASRAECRAFAAALRERGFATTVRYSLGADIAAACGQLVQKLRSRSASQDAHEVARESPA